MKILLSLLSVGLILAGCAAIVRNQLDSGYGAADPQRYASPTPDSGNTWQSAKQVLDRRCVLCHACYDAPCQLNLASSICISAIRASRTSSKWCARERRPASRST
jgi:hypothetical protein